MMRLEDDATASPTKSALTAGASASSATTQALLRSYSQDAPGALAHGLPKAFSFGDPCHHLRLTAEPHTKESDESVVGCSKARRSGVARRTGGRAKRRQGRTLYDRVGGTTRRG